MVTSSTATTSTAAAATQPTTIAITTSASTIKMTQNEEMNTQTNKETTQLWR